MVIDIIKRKQSELLNKLNSTNNNISNELLLELESFSNRLLESPDELNNANIEKYVNEFFNRPSPI